VAAGAAAGARDEFLAVADGAAGRSVGGGVVVAAAGGGVTGTAGAADGASRRGLSRAFTAGAAFAREAAGGVAAGGGAGVSFACAGGAAVADGAGSRGSARTFSQTEGDGAALSEGFSKMTRVAATPTTTEVTPRANIAPNKAPSRMQYLRSPLRFATLHQVGAPGTKDRAFC